MPPPIHKFYRHILTYKNIIYHINLQKNKGSSNVSYHLYLTQLFIAYL